MVTAGPIEDPTVETVYSVAEGYGTETLPVIDDDMIAVRSGDDYLSAVSTSGQQEWRFEVGGTDIMAPPPAIRDGSVYLPTDDTVIAVSDGKRQWAVNPMGGVNASPVVTEKSLYVTGDTLVAYEFDGNQRWSGEIERENLTKPAILGSTAFQVGLNRGSRSLIAWSTADGTKRWEQTEIGSSPAVGGVGPAPVVADGTVYTIRSTDDGAIVTARSTDNGTVQWESDPVSGRVDASPAVTDDELYLATERELYAFDVSDGSARWSSPYRATETIHFSPRVDAESVYLVTAGEKVVAVDRDSGEQRWTVALEETFSSGYTDVTIVDKTVYVSSDDLIAIS